MKKLLVITLSVVIFSVSLFAEVLEKTSAVVIEAKGKVLISYASGAWQAAKVGDKISENDMIKTENNSTAILKFDEETFTNLDPNSEIQISELKQEKGDAEKKFSRLKKLI